MKLSNCIERDWICCELEAGNRKEAFERIISELPEQIQQDVRTSLFDNEGNIATESFTVGQGVAFPHARTEEVKDIKTAIGLFPDGVSFEENGNEIVRIIVLFLFSEKRSGMYLKTLSAFSKVFDREVHLENLAQSPTPQSLLSYIEATGSQMLGDFSLHDLVIPPDNVLRKSDTLEEALKALNENGEHGVPVVNDEGLLVGRVTHADIIKICLRDYCSSLTTGGSKDLPGIFADFRTLHGDESVEQVMQTDVFSIDESCSLFQATAQLVRKDLHSAFVTADERLVGVFRLSDWTDKIFRFDTV